MTAEPENDTEQTKPEMSREERHSRYKKSEVDAAAIRFGAKRARFTLDPDLILPASSRMQIDEAITKITHHKKIYEEWGFKAVDPVGKGIILNFYGKPGTGKTMAAEALAGTLNRPFIAIGIAELESKFMGETAKNIQAAFAAALSENAVIFFDEADTLLGKRLSAVTQGVDNEVNAMRSTLLIELERFDGIAIFATNFAENYDKAFESRINHHIHLELPDYRGRHLLWNRMLVSGIPLATDRTQLLDQLANLSEGFSGRDIRTCIRLALPMALLASERTGVTAILENGHLEEAIHRVKKAQREIGTEVVKSRMTSEERDASYRMLGLKNVTMHNEEK